MADAHLVTGQSARRRREFFAVPEERRRLDDGRVIPPGLLCVVPSITPDRSAVAIQRIAISRSKRQLATGPRRYRAPALNEQLLTILDRMHELSPKRGHQPSGDALQRSQKASEKRPQLFGRDALLPR
jgi:hypothetical protein